MKPSPQGVDAMALASDWGREGAAGQVGGDWVGGGVVGWVVG